MRLWAVGLKSKLTTINHEGHHKPFYMYMNRFCDWVIIKKNTHIFFYVHLCWNLSNKSFLFRHNDDRFASVNLAKS